MSPQKLLLPLALATNLCCARDHVPIEHLGLADAPLFEPKKIVVFGDSISDSNGEFTRSHNTASTYNLLRTMKGVKTIFPDGSEQLPMDISRIVSARTSVEHIEAQFYLYVEEIRREGKEKNLVRRLFSNVKAELIEMLGDILAAIIKVFDKYEKLADDALLSALKPLDSWLTDELKNTSEELEPFRYATLRSLNRYQNFIKRLAETDLQEATLDLGEQWLLNLTKECQDMIPLVPDSQYYVEGKWLANDGMDQTWAEVLVKMMARGNTQVELDNRAMAGSWIMCAPGKLERIDTLMKTADGFIDSMKTLFQGSLVPPCEGAIVTSYLKQRMNWFEKENQRRPKLGDVLIEEDTLVVFFNGGNDFLNEWDDPDSIAQEHEHDIRNVLRAGAKKVAVVLLPDITNSPRYHPDHSKPKSEQAQLISKRIQRYNASMQMRIHLIREDYQTDDPYRLIRIDGEQIFSLLRQDKSWDFENPILDIAIPGMEQDVQVMEKERVKKAGNGFAAAIYENRTFDDTWHIAGTNVQTNDKVPFFSDQVHPSPRAHYAIAREACKIMQEKFNIPCNPDNYPQEQAETESAKRNTVHTTPNPEL